MSEDPKRAGAAGAAAAAREPRADVAGDAPSRPATLVFCEGCGARLAPSDRVCRKCGRPAPGILSTRSASSDLAAGKTASFPRVTSEMLAGGVPRLAPASASQLVEKSLSPDSTHVLRIPDPDAVGAHAVETERPGVVPDPYHRPPRRLPPRPVIVLAALVLALGGAVAFAAYDPLGVMPGIVTDLRTSAAEMFPSRAGTSAPADDGADAPEGADATQTVSDGALSDDQALAQLTEVYDRLMSYTGEDGQLGGAVDSFNASYLRSSLSVRTEASQGAYALRDAVQDDLDELDGMTLADGSARAEDLAHVTQLAQWLYQRIDAICQAWDVSLALPDGTSMSAHQDEILAPLREAGSEPLQSFDANAAAWRPGGGSS